MITLSVSCFSNLIAIYKNKITLDNFTLTLIVIKYNITFLIFTLSDASSFVFYSHDFVFRLDMSIRVSFLVGFVSAV